MRRPVAAVIQARMNSTRLPGKVLRPLAGRPLLWHVIHRLRHCRNVDQIALATSTSADDDPLVQFAEENAVTVVRGPEENVLERYRIAAELLEPAAIVRVTGDAPLVDHRLIDRLVEHLLSTQLDYCIWPAVPASVHEGIDPFRVEALHRLIEQAGADPIAREHVSAYFKAHPETFSIGYLPIDPREHFSGARFSVDTPADLRFLNEVYRSLGVAAGEADVRQVVELLGDQPQLLAINGHVYQKHAADGSRRIVIRCDGDQEIGLGHVVRSIALANELRDGHGWGVTFAMESGVAGVAAVRQADFPIELKPPNKPSDAWLDGVAGSISPQAVVFDTRRTVSRQSIAKLRRAGTLVVSIDDLRDHRLMSDLTVHPPVPQVEQADWSGFRGERRAGWEWVLLRREFATGARRELGETPHLLVTMGGSDPAGMTSAAVRALAQLDLEFRVSIVLGSGFEHDDDFVQLLASSGHEVSILRNVTDMASLMRTADLAIVSFGVTAYECAALSVPAIYLCLTPDHAASASVFGEHQMGISLGVFGDSSAVRLCDCVRDLLSNPTALERMSYAGRDQIDGRGAQRVAEWISRRCHQRTAQAVA